MFFGLARDDESTSAHNHDLKGWSGTHKIRAFDLLASCFRRSDLHQGQTLRQAICRPLAPEVRPSFCILGCWKKIEELSGLEGGVEKAESWPRRTAAWACGAGGFRVRA